MHIGLIGGIGPAAAAYYYRQLCDASTEDGFQMQLTMAHAQMTVLMDNIQSGSADRQAREFLSLGLQLKAAGARSLAITSLAGHFCIDAFAPISPLPIINAIPAVAGELDQRGCRRVGLLGTQVVMNSGLYGGLSGFEVVLPEPDEIEPAHAAYIGMAKAGQANEQQRETLFGIGRKLCVEQGADIVVLGGTDLFLAFAGHDCGFPVLDCADAHIQAIYRVMTGQ